MSSETVARCRHRLLKVTAFHNSEAGSTVLCTLPEGHAGEHAATLYHVIRIGQDVKSIPVGQVSWPSELTSTVDRK